MPKPRAQCGLCTPSIVYARVREFARRNPRIYLAVRVIKYGPFMEFRNQWDSLHRSG